MIIVRQTHETKQPVIATIGMFDGVHRGHCSLLQQVKRCATERDMCSAVVTFASHPRTTLHPQSSMQLLTDDNERMEHLAQSGIEYAFVLDFTKELSQLSAQQFITLLHKQYNIQGLYIGYDHRFGHNRSEGFNEYSAYGKQIGIDIIEALPYTCERGTIPSSSAIRKALTCGNITQATEMLGYNYTITGTVVEGHQLGRKLGFPTANIIPESTQKLIPSIGVYATKATLPDGSTYNCMMNIGTRPTVDGDTKITLEAHLLDFMGNLYGKTIRVSFLAYMREEMRYASLDELQKALMRDAEMARQILK